MKQLCKYLFRTHRRFFEDAFLEDQIGHIPDSIQEPVADFLSNSGSRLISWFLWQSHQIQKKMIVEPQNSEVFRGMLLEIKILLMVASRKKDKPKVEAITEEELDPLAGVTDFLKHGKNNN